ncbi:MAG TPA: VWA domain-containing protein [Terriglobia bacterium]
MTEPCDGFAGAKRRRRLRMALWLSFWLLPALAPGFFAAQQPPAQPPTGQPAPGQQLPTISKEVNVVSVLASVRNKHGEIIRNLTKDDFLLEEDGRPQTIRYFSRETDLPLTLGLLVDTSMSQRRVLDQERSASTTFLDQVLRVGKDVAFVIHFDRQVELLQDITSDRQKLQAALNEIGTPELARADPDDPQGTSTGPSAGGPHRGGGYGGGGTLLYDAVYLASNEMMKKQQGRKALLVLSDGVDHGSQETLASAIEAAQRADTLVYSVLFADQEGYGGGHGGWGGGGMGGMGGMGRHGGGGGGHGRYPQEARPDGKKILERMSKETGGQLFEVSNKEPLDQIYDQIQEALRSQYSLGYTPDPPDSGPGYHKIALTTKEKGPIVQARDGYYSER